MKQLLMIECRSVYGNPTYYPVNEQAKKLACLVGTKTLTLSTIKQAISMGFDIEAIGWVLSSVGHLNNILYKENNYENL